MELNVLMVSPEELDEPTGISVYVKKLKENLERIGIKVEVIHPRKNKKGVSYIQLPFSSGKIPNPFHFIYLFLKSKAKIVHAHGYINAFTLLAFLLSLLTGRVFILTIHGYPKAKRVKGWIIKVYETLLNPLFRRFSTVITVGLSRKVRKEFPKAIWMPNPFPEWKKCGKRWKYRLCFIGRLDPDKRPDLFLKMAKKLGEKEVLFAGREDEMTLEELKKTAKRLGINIKWVTVPYERMREVYCMCKYVVLPSRYEGYPLVLAEALKAGRLFLSTPSNPSVKRLASTAGEHKDLLIFKNVEEGVQKIKALEKLYWRVVEKVLSSKEMEDWTWEKTAKRMKEIYLEEIKNKGIKV